MNGSLILFSVMLLGACTTTDTDSTKSELMVESTNSMSTTREEEIVTIFTARIESVMELETHESAVQILLIDVEAVQDSENATTSFNDGVAINVDPATLDFNFNDLKAGDKLKVSLDHPAIMTMSIPPQIPGNSILSVELVK
ncbi:MAG TPA: hypothetical protein PLU84_08880 [Enterococcus aquimarinus]|nr:hypothetical protein [Enterococcus aquimarinus]HRM24566.1 hypothetical protein [Enterococcus aquimarinus]